MTTKEPSETDQGNQENGEDTTKLERRRFFIEGLRGILKPVVDLVEGRLDQVKQSVDSSRWKGGTGPTYDIESDRLIRPPGALEEKLFVERCDRSGECVAACPVQAIQFLNSTDDDKNGTPYVDPQVQACVVCEDLSCMKVCPSGALQQIPGHLIHMGSAELRRDICLRSDGEDCQICVEKCPLGERAISIPYYGDEVEVKTDGCVGCGVCEMYCPTTPRAIVVKSV